MKSVIRLMALGLISAMVVLIFLTQDTMYRNNNILFLFAVLIGLVFFLLRCGKCGARGALDGKRPIMPSFGFYFGSRCPVCKIERF